jgi:hypothetical protein
MALPLSRRLLALGGLFGAQEIKVLENRRNIVAFHRPAASAAGILTGYISLRFH